jgi:hypothetical protein
MYESIINEEVADGDESNSVTLYLNYLFDKISESYSSDFAYKILAFVLTDFKSIPSFQDSYDFMKRYYRTIYCQRMYFMFYYWNQKRLNAQPSASLSSSFVVECVVCPVVRFWYFSNIVLVRASTSMQFHLCPKSDAASLAFHVVVMTETIEFPPLLSMKANLQVITVFINELKKSNISFLCCQRIIQGNSSLFRSKLAQNRISLISGIPSKTMNNLVLISGARLLPIVSMTAAVEIPPTVCGVLKKFVYRSVCQKEMLLFTGFSSFEQEEISNAHDFRSSFSRSKCISTLLISHLPLQSFSQISQFLLLNESTRDLVKSTKASELQYIIAEARSYLRNLK